MTTSIKEKRGRERSESACSALPAVGPVTRHMNANAAVCKET